MSLSYNKIKKKPTTFNSLFGLSVSQFEEILIKAEPEWNKKVLGRYRRPGRPYDHPLEDMILILLLYYRCYITQEFLGYLFNLDKSRICRIIQTLEPVLATVVAISKRKHLSKKEVENLIIDATEQPVERPGKGQKSYYSGKKKRHTIKTEVRINLKGRIVHVSKSRPGSIHDFALYKGEPSLPPNTRVFADSGYQGMDKLHGQVEFPYKTGKDKPLDKEEKEYNRALSRIRIKIENIIGDLKTFRILSDRYRNRRKRYNLKFNIIAGIVNIKNGFAPV